MRTRWSIDELREGAHASISWQELCGGAVSLTVAGMGRVDGELVSGNGHIVHLRSERADVLISPRSVLEIAGSSRRADPPSMVSARLGWSHAFRLCQRDQDRITIVRVDSSRRVGVVDRSGRDFVRLRDDSGAAVVIPFAAIAGVICPR